MTVETIDGSGNPVTKSGPYNGNGATSVFDYDFQIQAETELTLTRQNADLTEDVLTLTTDYTVSGVGVDAGGQITLVAPATSLPTGTKLVIQYEGDLKQSADYSSQGSINLSELEAALDKLTMHLRGLQEAADRAVTVDAFGVVDVDTLRTNISALAAIEAQLVTLAANIADVNTAAGVSADITTVAGIAANVTSVAAISTDVTTAAANIAAIVAAPSEASAAAASATAALASETAAGLSAAAALASETAAGLSETAAAAAKVASELALDEFTDLYLGAKAADPTVDNDGDPLQTGALYFNTTDTIMKLWTGASWFGLIETPVVVLDEDDFASNSATAVPSQQSTKAYVDAAANDGIGFSPNSVYTGVSSGSTTVGRQNTTNYMMAVVYEHLNGATFFVSPDDITYTTASNTSGSDRWIEHVLVLPGWYWKRTGTAGSNGVYEYREV